MLKEHKELIDFINEYMLSSRELSNPHIKYTVNSMEKDFNGIEVHMISMSDLKVFNDLQEIIKEKYNDIISFIYTHITDELFVIYFKPIEEIRSKKINTIKSKINGI